MVSSGVRLILGEGNKCRIKGCSGKVVPAARDKHGAGFQGLCTDHIESQKEREKQSGDHQQTIRRIHGQESVVTPTVKRMLGESQSGKPVVVKQRSVDYQVCPHCNEEIHEKSLFSESEESPYMVHSCGGKVLLPETDPSTVVSWLRPYVEQQIEKRRSYLARESC